MYPVIDESYRREYKEASRKYKTLKDFCGNLTVAIGISDTLKKIVKTLEDTMANHTINLKNANVSNVNNTYSKYPIKSKKRSNYKKFLKKLTNEYESGFYHKKLGRLANILRNNTIRNELKTNCDVDMDLDNYVNDANPFNPPSPPSRPSPFEINSKVLVFDNDTLPINETQTQENRTLSFAQKKISESENFNNFIQITKLGKNVDEKKLYHVYLELYQRSLELIR
jgi:hypothetical protein